MNDTPNNWILYSNGGGFGAFTFHAHEHGTKECDSRGLPLTPNSIIMTGNFQEVKTLSHPNLCIYLDLVKCPREERLMCVSEYYKDRLEDFISTDTFNRVSKLAEVSHQILSGLGYLHQRKICVRNLSPETILLTTEKRVKLFNYGLFHITSKGEAVRFPIGSPRYLAPEVLLATRPRTRQESVTITTKSDVWTFGIILLELVMKTHIFPDLFLKNGLTTLFTRILRLLQNEQRTPPLVGLLEMNSYDNKGMDPQIETILKCCLTGLPSTRSSVQELLQNPLLTRHQAPPTNDHIKRDPFRRNGFRASELTDLVIPSQIGTLEQAQEILAEDHLTHWDIRDVHFLWCLAGGDVKAELSKQGLIPSRTPILTLPSLVSKGGQEFGLSNTSVDLYNPKVVTLPLDQLRSRLDSMTIEDYYPIMAAPETIENSRRGSLLKAQAKEVLEAAKLPLLIKESDVEYQFHRLVLYRCLLEGYPHTREMIINEALTDVCSYYRGPIWAAILNIRGDITTKYTNIDKDSETPTDRQIAVDIPRCHQYCRLLASRQGHQKFKRVLKAWITSHPGLVYWQGLDSLCAPFISLNFNNEALAYSCLSAFIDKFLNGFFTEKNSPLMQEYLAVFSQLIAYHDPELYNHLDNNMFYPDLYAIPWFLTMFTHVLPLQKIYHLWDTLLLGNPSFPLFAGLSILAHLRNDLFSTSDFSECILLFSDLPDIDIQQCTNEAVIKYQATPPSLCIRKHDSTPIQNPSIPPEARKEPLLLDTLKSECSPQISAHDLITLCNLQNLAFCYANTSPPPVKDPNNPLLWRKVDRKITKKREAVVLDIRSEEEYRLGHVPGSLHLPHDTAISPDGTLNPGPASKELEEVHKGKVIIVMGNITDPGALFARQLVRLNFPHVCLLYGGAGVLRSLGLLSAY